ncbi:MAG: ParA family protein [Ruminococcaceae bacterium]|nr:ParA family protein [Oscillospiraceae bacterium]MBQ8325359.1 ParA family protein [Clostridia bacterium]
MGKYRILCFANQKGGVGKTTSAVNVAACLARAGKKVLLVDADPQGNATSGIGVSKRELESTVYDVLIGQKTVAETVVETSAKNLFLLPSGIDLVGAELELADEARREYRLKDALEQVREQYDYIIIDCPPALGLVTINTLVAADGVIIPLLCEYYSLEGLTQLNATIGQIRKRYNAHLELLGVLLNMYDGRLNLTVSVLEEIKKFFPGKVFRTPIPRSVRMSEAPSHGLSIVDYEPHGKGAAAYAAVTRELMTRCE